MIRQADVELMSAGEPFDRDAYEDLERRRIAEQNERLAERDRRAEEQRRRQVDR